MLENTLEVIGDSIGCNLCAIYEASKSHGFRFMCGYKLEDPSDGDCLVQLTKEHAENALQYQKITFTYLDSSNILYFIPLSTDRTYGVLMLGFDKELDAFDMEIFESISDILSAAMDRFFLQQQINQQYFSTVKSLVVAIEAKDVYTQGHSQRVSEYSKIIGKHLMLRGEQLKELEITGLVHDVGKIGISDQLLTKPNKLTDIEFDSIKQHPEIGIKILQPLNVSENVMMGTLLHHKRYDLTGYPLGDNIDKLPLVPAIIGVADSFDAMTSERSYKKTMTKQNAIIELKKFRGTQFHPEIVDVVEELVSVNKL
jgi:HD-GYP domain-containing protein (c-di-GMP phosphodiesterase class II)